MPPTCGTKAVNEVREYSFGDSGGPGKSIITDIDVTVIPSSFLPDRLPEDSEIYPHPEMGDSLPPLTSGQKRCLRYVRRKETDQGIIIICRCNNPELTQAISLPTFSREIFKEIDSHHHDSRRRADGTSEFSWILSGATDAEIQQYVKWVAYHMCLTCWVERNGYDAERFMYDGEVVLTNGTTVESPYLLPQFAVERTVKYEISTPEKEEESLSKED